MTTRSTDAYSIRVEVEADPAPLPIDRGPWLPCAAPRGERPPRNASRPRGVVRLRERVGWA